MGVPSYPFTVTIDYIKDVDRKTVERHCADLMSAVAIYDDNIGRQYVRRITISQIIHQGEAGEKRTRR